MTMTDAFGTTLRQLRTQRGISLRQLSTQVNYDFGYLGQVERGTRPPTPGVAAGCDRALEADGRLVAAHEARDGETDLRRRTVLRSMGSLAAVAVGQPLVSLEALRQGIGYALDADYDEWQQIAEDYGIAFYTTSPEVLVEQLAADLRVLQEQLAVDHGRPRQDLARAVGRLSIVLAITLVATGQRHMARRFWRSAHRAARLSADAETQVLAVAWDAVNGCYDGRSAIAVASLTDDGVALASGHASAATAGVFAARAQAFAMLGRAEDAAAALTRLADITERLPAAVLADTESLWGWPEHRLRHTESYVYTQIGDDRSALAAQDRALALYPKTHSRLRTQVGLHRACCLVKQGHVVEGLRHAVDLLDGLPAAQHNALLDQVVGQVVDAVPVAERRRTEVDDLRARIPTARRV
jgi:transcriptional regulator with XRE-family HTH domain